METEYEYDAWGGSCFFSLWSPAGVGRGGNGSTANAFNHPSLALTTYIIVAPLLNGHRVVNSVRRSSPDFSDSETKTFSREHRGEWRAYTRAEIQITLRSESRVFERWGRDKCLERLLYQSQLTVG